MDALTPRRGNPPRNLLYDLPLTSGIGRATGSADPTFARASAASYLSAAGVWTTVASGAPRVDSGGLRLAPARTNKCYNNINPSATTGCAVSGGTLTVESDAAQLATDGCSAWGPNVYKFVPGAGAETFVCGAASGGTAAHSWSFLMRGDAGGEEPDYGHADSDGANFEKRGDVPALTTSWTRYTYANKAVDAADQYFAIQVPAGATVYIIAQQWEAGTTCTTPIPNSATAATAARAAETLTTAHTPADGQGTVDFCVTPMGWSGNAGGQNNLILGVGGGGAPVYCHAIGQWTCYDGTNAILSGVAPADGTRHRLFYSWGRVQRFVANGTEKSTAYDGGLYSVGAWKFQGDNAELAIDSLKIYRRPR